MIHIKRLQTGTVARPAATVHTRLSSTIPLQTKPVNKYNSKTSAFNFKPKPTNGLVYSPPGALPLIKQTPKAFLPDTDPRKHVTLSLDDGTAVSPYGKQYTPEEIEDMPIIYGSQKKYDVDAETATEILTLRTSDPKKWTLTKLCKKYNVSPYFVINLTKDYKPKGREPRLSNKQVDQGKRVKMWLSNQY